MRSIRQPIALVLAAWLSAHGCSNPSTSDDEPTATSTSELTYPTNPVLPLQGVVGTLPGTGSVAPDGSYNYELPLEVPPGRRGIAPHLSLTYNSRGGNGLLGVGWHLTGLSAIQPCPRTIAVDGYALGIQLDGSDALCWSGQRIVSAPDGSYRLDEDPSIKIDRSGAIITLHKADGSQLVFSSVVGAQTLLEYPLQSQVDDDGNSIAYAYTASSEGEYYPASITYTNHSGTNDGKRLIVFDYGSGTRPDPILSYRRGHAFATRKRLEHVLLYAPNPTTQALVGKYNLIYQTSETGDRSLLCAVSHVGALGGVERTKYFNWSSDSFIDYDPPGSANTPSSAIVPPGANSPERVIPFDIDGDGKDELLVGGNENWQVWIYSSPVGGALLSSHRPAPGLEHASLADSVVADIDGDGRTDLIAPWFAGAAIDHRLFRWSGSLATGSFAMGLDFGVYRNQDPDDPNFSNPLNVNVLAAADIDGDGRVDLVRGAHWKNDLAVPYLEPVLPALTHYTFSYLHNTSTATTPAFAAPLALAAPDVYDSYVAPLTGGGHATYSVSRGGGRQALVFGSGWEQQEAIGLEQCLHDPYIGVRMDGVNTLATYADPHEAAQSGYADVNGDGEADFVRYDVVNRQMCVQWGGAPSGTAATCTPVAVTDTTTQDLTLSDCSQTIHTGPWHLMIYDMDDDGKDDVILEHDGNSEAYRIWQAGSLALQVHKLAVAPYSTGDFDGDGLTDALLGISGQNNTYIAHAVHSTYDVIGSVSDENQAGGPIETVAYTRQWWPDRTTWPANGIDEVSLWAPAVDGGGTAPTASTCTFPERCLRTGMRVVRQRLRNVSSSAGMQLEEDYAYGDPRFDVQGRGFEGFTVFDTWEPVAMRETIQKYDRYLPQKRPALRLSYTITPIVKQAIAANGAGVTTVAYPAHGASGRARVVRNMYFYITWVADSPGTSPTAIGIAQKDEWEETLTYGTSATGVAPMLHSSHGPPDRTDAGASDGHFQRSDLTYDAWGNVAQAKTFNQGGLASQFDATYAVDTAHWWLARPTSLLVSTGCADTGCTSTSAGTIGPAPRRTDYAWTGADLHQINVEPAAIDPAVRETLTLDRDAAGMLTRVTHAAPGATSRIDHYTYDAAEGMFPATYTDTLGHVATFLYHPAFGALAADSDANGLATSFQVDEFGKRRSALRTGAVSYSFGYVPRTVGGALDGMIIQIAGSDGSAKTVELDNEGRPVMTRHTAFDGRTIVDSVTYDVFGREVLRYRPGFVSPSSVSTQRLWDTLGRTVSATDAAGNTTAYAQSFSGTTITDPNGHITDLARDADGRVIRSVQRAPSGTLLTTAYRYGDFDELVKITDPHGNAIAYGYDLRGRRTSVTDPDAGVTTTSYDGLGNVNSVTAGAGTTTYAHDALGRMTGATNADGVATYDWDTSAHGIGMPASAQSADGITHAWTYDTAGRLATETYSSATFPTLQIGRAYDAQGRISSLVYPTAPGTVEGLTVGYTYNTHGFLSSIRRTDSGSTTVYWTTTAESVDGLPAAVTYGNGIAGTRTFDAAGRITEIHDGGMLDVTYAYDGENRVRQAVNQSIGRTDTYAYDALERLSGWTATPTGAPARAQTFAYDDLGNLTSEKLGATTISTYGYGSAAGPHALTLAFGGAIAYDARGRQTSAPGRSVTYSELDLPRTVTAAGSTVHFAYDDAGARVYEQRSDGSVITLGDLYERRATPDGTIDLYYVHGPEGVVAQTSITEGPLTRGIGYVHGDRLGTVGALSNAGGSLVRRLYFDPFGKRTDPNAVPAVTIDFTYWLGLGGMRYDDDLGLVDHHGRAYDPSQRHFLSVDPVIGNPFDGQAYNHYSYAKNDPVNRIDPSGLADFPWDTGDPGGYEDYGIGISNTGGVCDMSGCGPQPYPSGGAAGGGAAAEVGEAPSPPQPHYAEPRALPTAGVGRSVAGGSTPDHATHAVFQGRQCPGTEQCGTAVENVPSAPGCSFMDFIREVIDLSPHSTAVSVAREASDAYEHSRIRGREPDAVVHSPVFDGVVAGATAYMVSEVTEALLDNDTIGEALDMFTRWKPGDDIYKKNITGGEPSWTTVRERFWKSESKRPDVDATYGKENLERMSKGRAPQRWNDDKSGVESMELSHEPIPQRDGGRLFKPRWPQDHAKVDPFRKPGY